MIQNRKWDHTERGLILKGKKLLLYKIESLVYYMLFKIVQEIQSFKYINRKVQLGA